jgi:hypothetical protein
MPFPTDPMTPCETIVVTRQRDEDASQVAAAAAKAAGTKLDGNLRWYDQLPGSDRVVMRHRQAPTADGRIVVVREAD